MPTCIHACYTCSEIAYQRYRPPILSVRAKGTFGSPFGAKKGKWKARNDAPAMGMEKEMSRGTRAEQPNSERDAGDRANGKVEDGSGFGNVRNR